MNAMSIGAAGAQNAMYRFDASAQRTVAGNADLAAEAVEQASDKTAFRASLAVITTSNEMSKQLLDITV